jgi:hypothetical protein
VPESDHDYTTSDVEAFADLAKVHDNLEAFPKIASDDSSSAPGDNWGVLGFWQFLFLASVVAAGLGSYIYARTRRQKRYDDKKGLLA